MNPELTPKQQASEAIRQAETILITSAQHPTIDQVAATLALAAILRKIGKKVTAIVTDAPPQQLNFLDQKDLSKGLTGMRDFIVKLDLSRSEVEKLRYEVGGGKLNIFVTPFKGGFTPADVSYAYGDYHYDLAVVMGVPSRTRIDRVYTENTSLFERLPIVNIDYHRSNEGYGAINLIEPNAASLCEILVALGESLQNGILDADIATMLLTGVMASTDRFTAGHTTSKSLTVAAQLMAAGARHADVSRALFKGNRPGDAGRSGESSRGGRDNRPGGERQPDVGRPERERREAVPQPAAEPVRDTAGGSRSVTLPADEPEKETADPIIEPGHIAFEQEGAVQPTTADAVPVRPESMPMADFAAAAEILRTNDGDSERSQDGRPAQS